MSLLKKNKVNCVDTNAYEQKYLKEVTVPLKHAAYISKRNIDIVSTLVRSQNKRGLTVGGYIDTVLTEHLEQHKAEINHLYRRERDDLV